MMTRDQVSGDAQVLSVLADRTPLLRRLHGDGGVDDLPPLFDLDGLDVEIPEDVRDELVRLLRILDDVDVLVDQALQLRDVLALLADRLADVAFFDFAARRTSRRPKRTSPVSAATRRARGTSITGRPLPGAPRGPAREPEASRRVSAWRRPSAWGRPEAACRSSRPRRCRG